MCASTQRGCVRCTLVLSPLQRGSVVPKKGVCFNILRRAALCAVGNASVTPGCTPADRNGTTSLRIFYVLLRSAASNNEMVWNTYFDGPATAADNANTEFNQHATDAFLANVVAELLTTASGQLPVPVERLRALGLFRRRTTQGETTLPAHVPFTSTALRQVIREVVGASGPVFDDCARARFVLESLDTGMDSEMYEVERFNQVLRFIRDLVKAVLGLWGAEPNKDIIPEVCILG